MQDGVDARGDLVAALALEALEVCAYRSSIAALRLHRVLRSAIVARQRALESEQIGERAGGRLPDRGRTAEVAMLLEQRDPQPGRRTTARASARARR